MRVKEILKKMTIEEKVFQLCSVYITDIVKDGEISNELLEKELEFGIGQVSRVYGGIKNIDPEKAKEYLEKIQKFLKEKTRLGIPAMIHEECLSGFLTNKATSFPQIIGIASSFNPKLIEKMTRVIRRQMRNAGVHQGLSPVLDVCYDVRWGRTEETFGEDPYLCALMGVHYVKGLQGENLKEGIVATGKHFAGHGFSEGGRNICPVHVGERELRDIFLFPFEACVKEANLKSIMNAYHDIDGIPCACSKKLLTDILRKEWGFDGIVVSDYEAIKMLNTIHLVAKDDKECAILSLKAGIDIELPNKSCYPLLIECVKKEIIKESEIDKAVERILKIKKELGLFEENKKFFIDFDKEEDRKLAHEIAKETFVLLKNDGILPLKNIKSISLIGPSVDSPRNYFGDYAYTAHLNLEKPSVECKSILEVFRERGIEVYYEKGCDIFDFNKENFEKAIEIGKKGEVIIFVGGDKSGFASDCTCGEGKDSHNLKLPGVQEDLILKLSELGKPLIILLITGRPYILTDIIDKVNAIVECWFPGEETANCIFDMLFGKFSPSGKLPVSFPKHPGQLPVYYHRKPVSLRNRYVYLDIQPLFPFGFGLSYSSFELFNFKIEQEKIKAGKNFNVFVSIKNTGNIEAMETVQLYIRKKFSSCVLSTKFLKGFYKVNLRPEEEKTIKFEIPSEILAFRDENMRLKIEEGQYEVMIGFSSEDIKYKGEIEIIGNKFLKERKVFFSDVNTI
ncbi:MAG: glycoside hydrolase family 3 C-terminal domain-containing protein [bacterium]|nr:glycoside hydrolase family 3 C-terminal domain-containing protein [bacterium]MDW8163857.1 glycoside hydrolase family 3 N-terminal domain-containing protein [Candidatus Omnitrophota bacterium]